MEDEEGEEGIELIAAASSIVQACWKDKKGKVHRLNGPAVIFRDGDRSWYKHGQRHRDDGPAREWPSQNKEEWWKDGKHYEPSAHELMLWKMKQKKE